MKKCSKCLEEKDFSEFHFKNKTKDKLQSHCKCCQKLQSYNQYRKDVTKSKSRMKLNAQRNFEETVKYIVSLLQDTCCKICGEQDILVLEFHHKDPLTKKYNVCMMIGKHTLLAVKREIAKCEVLCANCHRKETHRQNNSYKWKYMVSL